MSRLDSLSHTQGSYVAPSTPVTYSVDELRQSVGVNTHGYYTDTVYSRLSDVKALVLESGVAWVRDGLLKSPSAGYLAYLKDLVAAGVKTTLIVGNPDASVGYGSADAALLVVDLKGKHAGAISQLEGANERDGTSDSNPSWAADLSAQYDNHRAAIRADGALNYLRYAGPSMAFANAYSSFINANQEALSFHPYPNARGPEGSILDEWETKGATSAGVGKPLLATELGYHNAVKDVSGHAGTPEDVAAHYIVRTLVYNKGVRNIRQSYLYQLIDQRPDNPELTLRESWFGLVAVEGNWPGIDAFKANRDPYINSWTFRRKPGFYALKRLQAYLRDVGTERIPTKLPYRLGVLPASVIVLPFARRDGSFDLAVWKQTSLWARNPNPSQSLTPTQIIANQTLADSTSAVSFEFGVPVNVDSFRPSVGDEVTRVGTGVTSLNFLANGKVAFLRVRPV